jgi:hypothetical protein
MKQVRLFVEVDDKEVALLFTWDGQTWVCKMDDDFMQELGPLPFDGDEDVLRSV